jgi:catechol 2,3-dioxygenase-like lactoylglutathione lyase family enzyme
MVSHDSIPRRLHGQTTANPRSAANHRPACHFKSALISIVFYSLRMWWNLQSANYVHSALRLLRKYLGRWVLWRCGVGIVGIESVIYGVNDVAECTRYFVDFGLPLAEKAESFARFQLDEGSSVFIRHITDPAIRPSSLAGIGVCEVIWGVDTQDNLDRLVTNLRQDRAVEFEHDGSAHCLTDEGQAIGFRLYQKRSVVSAPDPVNSPGRVNRLNQHRRWLVKARPKTILHVVFQSPDLEKAWAFYRDRLGVGAWAAPNRLIVIHVFAVPCRRASRIRCGLGCAR